MGVLTLLDGLYLGAPPQVGLLSRHCRPGVVRSRQIACRRRRITANLAGLLCGVQTRTPQRLQTLCCLCENKGKYVTEWFRQ